jgi:hypothetical protein
LRIRTDRSGCQIGVNDGFTHEELLIWARSIDQ